MLRAAFFGTVLAFGVLPAAAAEAWLVVKDGKDAWTFEKSAAATNPATGFVHARIGRYHAEVQTDGDASYQFDMRRFEIDCAKRAVRQISNERMTKTGKSAAPAAEPADKTWNTATSGWPLWATWFACGGAGLDGALTSPNKAAAMIAMMGFGPAVSEIKPSFPSAASTKTAASSAKPAAASTKTAAAPTPSILDDKLCRDVRAILGKGQQETPAFNSFYASAEERSKYVGLGSTPVEGFGTCQIHKSAFLAMQPGTFFGSYYCTKTGMSEAEAATFAAGISKHVGKCLQSAYLSEGNDGGGVMKSYDHSMSMSGFPRVRVVHEKDNRVVIHLDSPGK
jgi:hypothetical protein